MATVSATKITELFYDASIGLLAECAAMGMEYPVSGDTIAMLDSPSYAVQAIGIETGEWVNVSIPQTMAKTRLAKQIFDQCNARKTRARIVKVGDTES